MEPETPPSTPAETQLHLSPASAETSAPPPPASPPPAPPNRRNQLLLLGGAGSLLALCCCFVLLTGAVVWIDPFGWGLLSFLRAQDPLVAAVPADVTAYLAFDVTRVESAEMQKLVEAFSGLPGAEGVTTPQAAIDRLDADLQEQLGLTFTDDIQPWIGRHVGLAVTDLRYQPLVGDPAGDFVLLVEARDARQADAFVAKFTQGLGASSGTTFSEIEYEGVTIYIQQGGEEPLAVAQSKKVVLLGNSVPSLERVLDVQAGNADPLSKDAAYTDLQRQAPKDILFSFYFPGEALVRLNAENQQNLGLPLPNNQAALEAVRGALLTVSAVESGVQMDIFAAYDESRLPAFNVEVLTLAPGQVTLERLPEDALVYVQGTRLDLMLENARAALEASDPGAFDEAMESFEQQFGFNPASDLLAYLNGDYAVALLRDPHSFFAQNELGEIGFAVVAQSGNDAALQATLARLNAALEDNGTPVEGQSLGGIDAFGLGFIPGAEAAAYYGVGQNWLSIASSAEVFSAFYQPTTTLAASATHQQRWAAFPAGTAPVMYVDVPGLVQLSQDSPLAAQAPIDAETLTALAPIRAVAMGAQPYADGLFRATLIVFIEKP